MAEKTGGKDKKTRTFYYADWVREIEAERKDSFKNVVNRATLENRAACAAGDCSLKAVCRPATKELEDQWGQKDEGQNVEEGVEVTIICNSCTQPRAYARSSEEIGNL